MRAAILCLALTGCAHAAPPTPAEKTALIVDSIALVVDVIAYVDSKATAGPLMVVPVYPDGGEMSLCAPGSVSVAGMLVDAGGDDDGLLCRVPGWRDRSFPCAFYGVQDDGGLIDGGGCC